MPELPEVETVRRGLAPELEGCRIIRVHLARADLRRPFPDGFANTIEGRRVTAVARRSKYLLVHLAAKRAGQDDVLIIHLGMSGRMAIHGPNDPPPGAPGPHDHVIFVTDRGARIVYTDPRRFGLMTIIASKDLARHPLLAGIGPEPLEPGFDGAVLAANLKGRRTPIKSALLDQRTVAGLGNIYVCESLFRAGISPKRSAARVQGGRADRLVVAIREVLSEAIAAGGSTLRDHIGPTGELGYFQHHFAVYGREGAACPGCCCDKSGAAGKKGGIRRIVQAGRSTFYCPTRQR